jgi:polyisoprenoid-binding protein YceI
MTTDLTRLVHGQELPAAGVWEMPPARASIHFTLRRRCARPLRGQFRLDDGLILIAADPHESVAAISIDASSLNSSNPRRDARMRSRVLATDRFPTIDLFIDSVEQQTRWEWTALGTLRVRDNTIPVALCFTYDDVDDRGDARFRARTTLSVVDLGIRRRWARLLARSWNIEVRAEVHARCLSDIADENYAPSAMFRSMTAKVSLSSLVGLNSMTSVPA